MSSSRKPEGEKNSTNMYKLLLTERKKKFTREKNQSFIFRVTPVAGKEERNHVHRKKKPHHKLTVPLPY